MGAYSCKSGDMHLRLKYKRTQIKQQKTVSISITIIDYGIIKVV